MPVKEVKMKSILTEPVIVIKVPHQRCPYIEYFRSLSDLIIDYQIGGSEHDSPSLMIESMGYDSVNDVPEPLKSAVMALPQGEKCHEWSYGNEPYRVGTGELPALEERILEAVRHDMYTAQFFCGENAEEELREWVSLYVKERRHNYVSVLLGATRFLNDMVI